jgi:hypothetical protein
VRKQAVRVHWEEAAESPGYLSDARKKIFLEQISACGIEPTENSDAPVLNVSMRVTASRVLLIADASDAAGGRQTNMIDVPRASLFVVRATAQAPQLRRELLWQQEKPIQSALEWQDPATQERFLFLLSEGQFLRFHSENSAWQWMDSTEYVAAGRRSRAGEGSLFYSRAKERVELVLRKKVCDLDLKEHVSLSCANSEGGDRAAKLSSACEESSRYLAAGKGDYTQTDRITLASVPGAGAAVSADENYTGSVDMPGPVLGLSVAENSTAASAVVKNLSTGNYEVYRITAVCSN